ncbi:hypothetical protein ACTFIY_011617 [Dictyostelium cf. discoideum]
MNSLKNYINRERNEIKNLKSEIDQNLFHPKDWVLEPLGAILKSFLSDLSNLESKVDLLSYQRSVVTESLSYFEQDVDLLNSTKNWFEQSLNELGIKKTNDENFKNGLELLKIKFGMLSIDSDFSRELLGIGRNHFFQI